jgi:hypothetical protein
VGFAYHGTNEQRQSAAFGEALSPLRLFCSITPPDTPVPWLLAAVNPQIDRGALIEGRGLCNRLDVAVLAPMEQLRLRIPGLPGGWWVPDSYGSSNYCGISGEGQWEQEVCQFLQDEHSPGPSLIPNLYQCSAALQTDMLHESKGNGVWRSRNCSTASAAICGGTVEIKHQYRQLGFFEWNWVTARIDLVHPTNFTETFWLGIVRRRRRIRYLRVNSLDGGFRAASKFSQHLSSELWNHLVEVWGAD